ncbi:M23 family metallopeptidase [Paenibacillus sp. IB182496]|uniref:M23 family metallopeptidase n=1 Tax=Paenibacillus sabuli TaxID=2772509 RepID=A0A927BRY1_9BACL|nr:M23 family metallopeptidase [Paenibacillus sabuli]
MLPDAAAAYESPLQGAQAAQATHAPRTSLAAQSAPDPQALMRQRRGLFEEMSALTGIPWHYLAAIDQYERTLTRANSKTRPAPQGAIAIAIAPERWAGPLNPDPEDKETASLRLFGGIGRDGNGDGLADRASDADLLYTVARHLLKHGTSEQDFAIGLWEYYHNTRAVQRVRQFAAIYATYDRLELSEHAFPVPVGSNYSYRSTWGTARSWGGYRIHEGTDIFAPYGLPVRSTCYGIVEIKGWNRYGGWRIGIRDLDNIYHYYAHLSGYDKTLEIGEVVKPGQIVGWVGSSGYGKPGTQGKFPPHLHYGVYRDRGLTEWAFDPYPMLHQWEQAERRARKSSR